ncbi:MAG: DNA repair protein RadC [Acholeplasmatales bacterium]|nr:DNA repair protein RadC [Acholeplasmatales bacterium]
MIKEIPKYERPREKLLKNGIKTLSNTELLAIILKSGTKGKSVIDLSNEILYSINSLKDLNDLELLEITKIKGVGKVKAMEILASIELGRRIYLEKNDKIRFKTSKEIYLIYKDILNYSVEHFYVLYFDSKLNLICEKDLFTGDSNLVIPKPNEIFKYAIKIGAQSFVIMHNHPSGDPKPSKKDIIFTSDIKIMSETMNILLLDHIIIGDDYYSFLENGKI